MTVNQHDRDLFCLRQAGYIILRDFVDSGLVAAIEKDSIAFEDEVEEFRREREVHLSHSWPLRTTRCLYAVSPELQDLVMCNRIQRLVENYLGPSIIRDSLMQTNMPDPKNVERGLRADISFHRDTLWTEEDLIPQYLHVFLLLTDFTEETGGTIVVPGSHREREPGYYFKHADPRPSQKGIDYQVYEQSYFPSCSQLLAPRGSLILLDPMMIHSQGINITEYPRRIINTTFRAEQIAGRPPLLNARAIAKRYARVPVRDDFMSLLEGDERLPGYYGPLDDALHVEVARS